MSTAKFFARVRTIVIALLSLAAFAAAPAAAQSCGPQWLPRDGDPGTNERVYESVLWDPDGSGPRSPVVVVGGLFDQAGGSSAQHIAMYDPATGEWSPLGSGMNSSVFALEVLPNGDLVAGGSFNVAGGVGVGYVARWNGTEWSELGAGVNWTVSSLAVLPNGDLVAGGAFTSAGAAAANYIARWDGSSWSPLGSGLNGTAYALAALPDGSVVAGGAFSTAGGAGANRVARWNGQVWSVLGSGMDRDVYALKRLGNGDLIAGGWFTTAGGNPAGCVARWDGIVWTAVGGPIGASVGIPEVYDVTALPSGDIIVGGAFNFAGATPAQRIARFSSGSWSALGAGLDGWAGTLTVMPGGELFVGGVFSEAGGQSANRVARYSISGIPWVAMQPFSRSVALGDTVTLSVTPATKYSNVSVQWQRNGVPITDGPGGASIGGGTVSGATRTLESPTNGIPAMLTIENAQPSDAGEYTAVFFNACGSATSEAATLVVDGACPADFDNTGFVDTDDFTAFVLAFEAGTDDADFDGTGFVDTDDFTAFVLAFEAGC